MLHATQTRPVSNFFDQIKALLAEIAAGNRKSVEASKPLLEKPVPRLYYPYGIKGEAPRGEGEDREGGG